jgi:hypothetical protein
VRPASDVGEWSRGVRRTTAPAWRSPGSIRSARLRIQHPRRGVVHHRERLRTQRQPGRSLRSMCSNPQFRPAAPAGAGVVRGPCPSSTARRSAAPASRSCPAASPHARAGDDVASRNQCSSRLNAFSIASWGRIAGSHATPAYAVERPNSPSYLDTPTIESGLRTCSRERPDHVEPLAAIAIDRGFGRRYDASPPHVHTTERRMS